MATDWYAYQEEAAELFRSIGLVAETNVTLKGVRTSHAIDVVVKSQHAGFSILWLVECKHWKTPVTKLHVLGLREIVADLGADRGILLCEVGFQSGAHEAANLTNVQLTSLAKVRGTAGHDIAAMRLRELFDRAALCRERYWDLSKDVRIRHGLRPDSFADGYSGTVILEVCNELLPKALRGTFPVRTETLQSIVTLEGEREFVSGQEVIDALLPLIVELEQKIEDASNSSHS